jgi:hypothetical protein
MGLVVPLAVLLLVCAQVAQAGIAASAKHRARMSRFSMKKFSVVSPQFSVLASN